MHLFFGTLMFIACFLLFLMGCAKQDDHNCLRVCSSENKKQAFQSLSLEEQFNTFHHCRVEKACFYDSAPATTYWGNYFAENVDALGFILEKLKTSDDIKTKYSAFELLESASIVKDFYGRNDIASIAIDACKDLKARKNELPREDIEEILDRMTNEIVWRTKMSKEEVNKKIMDAETERVKEITNKTIEQIKQKIEEGRNQNK